MLKKEQWFYVAAKRSRHLHTRVAGINNRPQSTQVSGYHQEPNHIKTRPRAPPQGTKLLARDLVDHNCYCKQRPIGHMAKEHEKDNQSWVDRILGRSECILCSRFAVFTCWP